MLHSVVFLNALAYKHSMDVVRLTDYTENVTSTLLQSTCNGWEEVKRVTTNTWGLTNESIALLAVPRCLR